MEQQVFETETTASTQDKNKARHAVTIDRTPGEVYFFWRNFENLALFMKDVAEIKTISATRFRWKIELKSGRKAEWDAEIVAEVPGEMISWRSVEGSEVRTSGTVKFAAAPGNRGAVVKLSMDYSVPGGKLTEWFTFFTGEDPDTLILTNLKRLKQVLETGEYATIEGQPSGREENSTYVMKH